MTFLLHWPLWLSALTLYVLFGACALVLSVGVANWVRRQPARLTAVTGIVGTVGAAMTAGFLVWMGLLATLELRDIDSAERATRAEAAALHALDVLAARTAPGAVAGWHAQLATYGEQVLAREWPTMSQLGPDAATAATLDALHGELYQRFAGEPDQLRRALGEALQDLVAAREARLLVASGHIPAIMWYASLICAFIVLLFAALVHAHLPMASRWITVMLGLLIAVEVHAVYVIDRPFVGAISVSDAPLRTTVLQLQKAGARS